ncbi:uncharacterized protein LOC129397445 [Pan paniscus]|uniref:uncharacterized protein LOC129397445 n=1 Tax=Pan paniscus TaxID=9597 RepID=UPI0030072C8E
MHRCWKSLPCCHQHKHTHKCWQPHPCLHPTQACHHCHQHEWVQECHHSIPNGAPPQLTHVYPMTMSQLMACAHEHRSHCHCPNRTLWPAPTIGMLWLADREHLNTPPVQQVPNLKGPENKARALVPASRVRAHSSAYSINKARCLNPPCTTIKLPRASKKIKAKNPSTRKQLQRLKEHQPTNMRKNQHKNSGNSKSQSVFLPPNNCTSSPAMILNLAEMTDVEFRIWIEKIIEIQEKVKTQSKKSKEYNKTIQELKYEMAILRKDQTDLIELKNSLPEFHNTIANSNTRIDQAVEKISKLKCWFSKLTQTKIKKKG